MRFNALRVLLNTVHVFCLLTCVWFVVMLCILMALLVLLVLGIESADCALDFVQTAEKVPSSHVHTVQCAPWLEWVALRTSSCPLWCCPWPHSVTAFNAHRAVCRENKS